uniref:Type I polyketide synthase n=1 Tax=Gambierdiscus excentricus TaxID=986170 RepID=A0A1S6K8I8_9DINO|nr:type I polyketide synthase [Gambierdiscus excentricus]
MQATLGGPPPPDGGMYEVDAVEVELDFSVASLTESDDLGARLTRCLQRKGFCAVDLGLSEKLLPEALQDVAALEHRLARPPEEVQEGLLGDEGSGRVAELTGADEVGRALGHLDALLTELQWEVGLPERTGGLLHEAGLFPVGQVPELGLEECARWHGIFSRGRVLLLLWLGSGEARLALRPQQGESDIAAVVRLAPGTLVALRVNAVTQRLAALGENNYALTCFLLGESVAPNAPCAQRLSDWAQGRLCELKSSEVDEAAVEAHRSQLPRRWRRLMNHNYFRGHHATVAGMALRSCSSWKVELLSSLQAAGADLASRVPLMRYDWEETYDPSPESWQWGKTSCWHGSFMEGAELFDNRFFLVSPAEASSMDPHQRMLLDVGYEAAQRAGLNRKALMGAHGGVYVGMSYLLQWAGGNNNAGSFNQMSGASRVIPANRMSYVLGTKGPSTSMDVGEASSLSACSLGREGVSRADKERRHTDFSLCLGINIELAPNVAYQQWGWLSPSLHSGRCFTFDAGTCGVVPADGACAVTLKLFAEVVDDKLVPCEQKEPRALLASSAVLHAGQAGSLTAPCGPAQQEAVAETLRWARLAPDDIDVSECHGASLLLDDVVEMQSLAKALSEDDAGVALQLSSLKSGMASSKAAGGIVGLAKVLVCAFAGAVGPNQHLRSLNPYARDLRLPVCCTTELLNFQEGSVFSGVASHGAGGVRAHAIAWGRTGGDSEEDSEEAEPVTSEPFDRIAFWPVGGGTLPEEACPTDTYYVAGSWSGWSSPEPMEHEGDGVFGFTVTLGENRWEMFQIWLDQDPERALHPGRHHAGKGLAVQGPSSDCSEFAWRIEGREHFEEGEDGEAFEVPNEDHAFHGDRFRVRLRIAGGWRTVDWDKLGGPAGSSQLGRYYLVSDWTGWNLDSAPELLADPVATGVFQLDVGLIRDGGEFQIVRNRDWGQVLCPAQWWEDAACGEASGPEDTSFTWGCNWCLQGRQGDTFRIEFQLCAEGGIDRRTVSWKQVA